jgi:hypothetical protein
VLFSEPSKTRGGVSRASRPCGIDKSRKVGYFVEWECGVDLSADTIDARWKIVGKIALKVTT